MNAWCEVLQDCVIGSFFLFTEETITENMHLSTLELLVFPQFDDKECENATEIVS
jgi:hypothetical protein